MTGLFCADEHRRGAVREAPLFGLDFVEVRDRDQRTLEVFFLGKAPGHIQGENVQIRGGRRIRDVRVTGVRVYRQPDPALDDYLIVEVNQSGDASEYELRLVKLDDRGRPTDEPMDGFDPHFASVCFTFTASCPTDLDCKQPQVCPPPVRVQPDINYLAKDYGSFRQLLLDRLAQTLPQWREQHVPDIGIMLVELLAYVGDYLSYYQDAVATEAYLGTARQRISVRRHARLVDYRMHEGSNARAWVTIHTDADAPLDPRNTFFTTPLSGTPNQRIFLIDELKRMPASTYQIFRPLVRDLDAPIHIYQAHSEIAFYTWGDCACCLAKGATTATLVDAWVPVPVVGGGPAAAAAAMAGGGRAAAAAPAAAAPVAAAVPPAPPDDAHDGPPGTRRALQLAVDDVLIFEEVMGPATGNPADADPSHRQAVRLTKVTRSIDPLYHPYGAGFGQPVVEITWCSEDALTFPLCLSAHMPPPACDCRDRISVARGNVILVDHGATVRETPLGTVPVASTSDHCACGCEPPHTDTIPASFCPELGSQPLTHSQPLPLCGCAGRLLIQDPRLAVPQVTLTGTLQTPHGTHVTTWTPVPDLLESGPHDPHFVVETDDEGRAHLRFGDGDLGEMPAAGTVFDAEYRVGNGTAGHVGAEAITCIVFTSLVANAGTLLPRNPLPAVGGIDPEPVEEVKAFAPHAFRSTRQRAITADDYAALAADNERRFAERPALMKPALLDRPDVCAAPFHLLQGAKARLRWTGGWNEVFVAIDPQATEEVDPELLAEIGGFLEPYRRIGHDLDVKQAEYVGLDLGLHICVLPEYLRGHVKAALIDVFSNRVLPDGTRGVFHPDNLTFGQGIYVSRLIAAAQRVTGVQHVEVTRLTRFEIGEPRPGPGEARVPAHGVLALGAFEIARLDNDPNFPENGRLTLDVGGGR